MEELFTNTLSPLALFPVIGKLLVRGQIKRRCFLMMIMVIITVRGQIKRRCFLIMIMIIIIAR